MPFVADKPGGRFVPDAPPAVAGPEQPEDPSLLMAPVGGAEMLAKRITGAVAAIPAGVAYGGAALGKAVGADVNPAQVQERTQNYFTYQPQTASGQAGERQLSALTAPITRPIAQKLDQAASAVGRVSPTAETFMREAPGAFQAATGVMPLIAGARALATAKPVQAAEVAAAPSERDIAAQSAKEAGYKLTPEQEGRKVGEVLQGLSGSAKLERSLSKHNATITDNLAKNDIGIPEGQPLNAATIAQKRSEANAAYGEVGKIGRVTTDDTFRKNVAAIGDRSGAASFPEDTPAGITNLKGIYGNKIAFDAKDAVAKVRQLRADASKNLKALNAPEQNALGAAQKQLAEALDDQLERAAQTAGQPDVLAKYRSARVQLARIHSIEDALEGTNVSAKALHQQQERGVPLSGGLKTIADTYASFDRSLQDISKIRDSGPLGVVDLFVGAGGATASPALAAAVLARPAIRAALASKAYQRRGIQPQKNALGTAGQPNALATPDLKRGVR